MTKNCHKPRKCKEGEFYCTACFKNKPLAEVGRNYTPAKNTAECRKCKSEMNMFREIRNKVELNPENYLECNNCDLYFSIFDGSRKNVYGNRILRTSCFHCGSHDIHRIPKISKLPHLDELVRLDLA